MTSADVASSSGFALPAANQIDPFRELRDDMSQELLRIRRGDRAPVVEMRLDPWNVGLRLLHRRGVEKHEAVADVRVCADPADLRRREADHRGRQAVPD